MYKLRFFSPKNDLKSHTPTYTPKIKFTDEFDDIYDDNLKIDEMKELFNKSESEPESESESEENRNFLDVFS